MKPVFRWWYLVVSLAIVLSMALVGLSNTANAASTQAKSHAKSKAAKCAKRNKASGTVRYSDWEFPDTLNPVQTTEAVSTETLNGMFDSLVQVNSQAHYVPQMITKMPTVKNGGIQNGGKTVVMHLKQGLRWSNGQALTSADVKFGWHVGMDKLTGPVCSGSCDIISRIDTPDKYTVVFHLKKVYAPFLAYGLPPIWPTKWAGAWNNNAHDAANKIGQDQSFNFETTKYPTSGAYQAAEFVKDDRIVLQPMKYYADMNCGGYVKNLIFAFYSSKPALIAAAAAKQTDVTQDYTVADLPELKKHTSAYKLFQTPGFSLEHLELNNDPTFNGATNPLHNANVRLALALALDKVGLIQSALGVPAGTAKTLAAWTPWVNTKGLVQPFANKQITGQWDPKTKKFNSTPGRGTALADAKKLLSTTQWKSGFTVDFYTTSGNPTRQAQEAVIAASWARIGVKVNPNFIPASKLFADWDHGGVLQHGAFQVGMWGYLGQPDPDQWKFNMQSQYIDREKSTHALINANEAGIHDKVLDTNFNTGAHSFSSSVRSKAYSAIQLEMNKMAYWIPLYFRPQIATADNRVGNAINNPTQFGITWNMYDWRAKSS